MIILISPSKTLDFTTPVATGKHTLPDFLPQSEQLIGYLRKFSRPALKQLMKISDKIADLNYRRYRDWHLPFTPENARQAVFAFKGDVYSGLDIDSFSARDLDLCQKRLRILSGLYGLLRPLDLIQPYRLEMGTRLKTAQGANLYAFWQHSIAEAINEALRRQKSDTVVNLASNEYFKAACEKQLAGRVISPAFKEYRNGEYKMIGLYAKKARGLMARFILLNRITDADGIKAFDDAGYRFSSKLSSGNSWVFTRRQ